MKKKSALIFGFGLVTLLSFGSGVVLSQNSKELPRVTTVCETKLGGMLFGLDDGFSTLKFCPKNTRKVNLGEKQDYSNESAEVGGIKFIGFTSDVPNIAIIDKTGKTYLMDRTSESDKKWSRDVSRDLPSGVTVNDLAKWNPYMLLTFGGKIWYYQYVADNPGWIGPFSAPTE